jgi:NADH dehydrogenase
MRAEEVVLSGPLLGKGATIPPHQDLGGRGTGQPAATLGLADGPSGGSPVRADLSVAEHPEIFAIGDVASAHDGDDGSVLPQLAPVAMQGGEHAAAMIGRRLNGEATEAFSYTDKGTMATIGRASAVAQLPGGIRLSGLLGWLAWLALHLVQLVGFRNRANVLVNWAWNYVTYDQQAESSPRPRWGPSR